MTNVIRSLPMPYKIVRPHFDGSYTEYARFAFAMDCQKAWESMIGDVVLIAIDDVLIDPTGVPQGVVVESMLDANGLFFTAALW